jgi:Flp pilus assembly protein TadB
MFVEPVGGSMASLTRVASPIAQRMGIRISRILGVSEELALRLERIHSPLSVSAFRLRQLTWSMVAFGCSALVVGGTRPPMLLVPLFLLGAPLLAFLVLEQHLARSSARWQRREFLELPVVAEQLGMLLSAGYSVGAALNRLADRGQGASAADLHRVCNRIRHGLGEHDALQEWADLSGVPAVGRLVAVLLLDRDAGDLGRLITEESRAVRREVHRELIEIIERRSQQVWVPVTVATLLPGVVFLAVPFVAAMQLFTSS